MSARAPPSLSTILLAFAACVLLLAANLAVAFMPVGHWHAPLAIGLALGEAAVLGIVWMELWRRTTVLRLAALLPLAWLLVLIVLIALDATTRVRLPPLP